MRFAFFLAVAIIATTPCFAAGNTNKPDLEKFYKPVTQKDLMIELPPRDGASDRFGGADAIFSGNGGCPDEINIGSVPDDSTVIGSTNIDVSIQGDIIVNCSGF